MDQDCKQQFYCRVNSVVWYQTHVTFLTNIIVLRHDGNPVRKC